MTLVLALGAGISEVGGPASGEASWTRGLGLGPEGRHGLERRGSEAAMHVGFGGPGGMCSVRVLREAEIPGKWLQPGGVRAA